MTELCIDKTVAKRNSKIPCVKRVCGYYVDISSHAAKVGMFCPMGTFAIPPANDGNRH